MVHIERLIASMFMAIVTQMIFIANYELASKGSKSNLISAILMSIVIICILCYAYYIKLDKSKKNER